MKSLLYLFLFLTAFNLFSQRKALEITNIKNGKIKLFVENQRVKIRTLDRKKRVGKIHFSDNQTLIIDNKLVKIDSILSIKKQPLAIGTIKTGLFIVGFSAIGASAIVASSGNDSSILLFLGGTATTITSGLIEGLNKKSFKQNSTFKIIDQ